MPRLLAKLPNKPASLKGRFIGTTRAKTSSRWLCSWKPIAEGSLDEKVGAAVSAYCQLADEDFLLFSFHLVSLNRYLPYDKRREDDPVSITERVIAGLMQDGTLPKGDPAVKAAMALGVIMQAGQNKIYNRLPGPLSQHKDAFTKGILAVLYSG